MDASSSSSLQTQHNNNCLHSHNTHINRDGKSTVIADSNNHCSHPKLDISSPAEINGELKRINRCRKKITSVTKRVVLDASELASSSSSPSSSSMDSSRRNVRVPYKKRNPRALVRRNRSNVAAIGLPLGMSFAAVMAQVDLLLVIRHFRLLTVCAFHGGHVKLCV